MALTSHTTRQFIKAEMLLFDLDGTLVDSTEAVNKHWTAFGREIAVDPVTLLQAAHGRRTIDTLEMFCPERANWKDVQEMEASIPRDHGESAKLVPGASELLQHSIEANARWAIVTSGSAPLARGWLDRFSLPVPQTLVTAESVSLGKPDPAGYELARAELGRGQPATASVAALSVVFEDSPAGIRAGKAAGCTVVGLVTSHDIITVRAAGPDWVVYDLSSVRVVSSVDRLLTLELDCIAE
ncbi:glycerol-1-phosphatase [Microdochium nivale]|nr:glycerol-1-phosphatase [Microdochium nivale]